MIYIYIENIKGEFFISLNSDKTIIASKSKEEGIERIERIFNEYHKRDYTWSMSTTIMWMDLNVRVCGVEDEKFLEEKLLNGPPFDVVKHKYGLSMKTNQNVAKELYEKGKAPRLISRDEMKKED